jgi:CHAT domain-containing protein
MLRAAIVALLVLLCTSPARADDETAARNAIDALFAGTIGDPAADVTAFRNAMQRFECVESAETRVIATTTAGDTTTVDLVVSASDFPSRWRVTLHRGRVVRIDSAERDLATAMAFADPPMQDQLLHDCGELVSPELVHQLVDLGVAVGSKGRFADEERLARTALSLADELRDPRSHARALWLLGRARDTLFDYDEALVLYEQSRALAEANGDRDTTARALIGLGFTYVNRYEFDKAHEPLNRGLDIALSVGDYFIADNACLAMAITHYYSGEYVAALRDYDRTLDYAQRAGDRVVVAAATANSALVFEEMNNYEVAVERLREAIAVYHSIGHKRGEMRNLRNLADAEAAASHLSAATHHLDQIEAYLAKEPNNRLAAFVAATRVTIANLRHDVSAADRAAKRALELAKNTDDHHLVTSLTDSLSGIRFRQKRYREAAEFAEQAIELSEKDPLFYPSAKINAARAYEKLGRHDEEARALHAAIDAIESQLANVPGTEDEQQTFYRDKSGPYYQMFRLLVSQRRPEEAIAWVERSRTRSLIEYLGRNRVSADRGMLSAEERKEEATRQQEIVALNRNLRELYGQAKPDAAAIAHVDEEAQRKRFALQDYEARLYSRHPSLALARGAIPRPSLAEVQKLIPPDGAILQYIADADETWLVVIRRHGAPYITKIVIDEAKLERRVTSFVQRIAQRDLGSRGRARTMYDLLLKPVEPVLRTTKSLCIIPDGSLWHVPFQALIDQKGQYLAEQKTIFYTPSLSLLAWYARNPPAPSSSKAGVLVLANPQLTEGTVKMARAVQRGENLGPLPDAEAEARHIKALYGRNATVLVGGEATESFVKRNAGRYRMIHLATHAVFDDTSPLHSYLVLAAGKSAAEDGLLEAREIMNLDLATDLVVLSSCETGRGQVRGGDGLVGMSWALLVAGCPTAVVSQWKVGSAATEKLMTEFHRHLSRVPPNARRAAAAHALRDAERTLLRLPEFRYPYDWSAFVVIGNGW